MKFLEQKNIYKENVNLSFDLKIKNFHIFSVKFDKKHIKLNILGFIKFNLKRPLSIRMYLKFFNKEHKANTILIIEQNNCHFETMPGLCKYCLDLGYNVDVLTRNSAENIFDKFDSDSLRVYECCEITFDKIYKNFDFSKYERIIYNSKRIYFKKKETSLDGYDLSEYYDVVRKGKKENIYLQHHIDMYDETPNDLQIVLANPAKRPDLNNRIVNCHYFKNNQNNISNKNIITNFISIGELAKHRRNSSLLINAVKELDSQGVSNFKITIIGKGELESIPLEIRHYFNILGRVDYQTMFSELEKSDFILPLLDPNIKSHKRYMNSGTSGTFQLIYGFNKPCIIHKTFADIYGFDDFDSLIYEDDPNFSEMMLSAINLKNEEYKKIQECLKIKAEMIKTQSIKNLKNIFMEGV